MEAQNGEIRENPGDNGPYVDAAQHGPGGSSHIVSMEREHKIDSSEYES